MGPLLEYTKITDARSAISEIYSTAERHLAVVMRRESDAPVAVIRRDDLKRALRALCPLETQVRFSEDEHVSMWIEGLPVSGEGSTFESAGADLVHSLREYSRTWVEDLRDYPNHKQNWGVVNLVLLSDDDELQVHMFGDE
jgi:hypothetical protein